MSPLRRLREGRLREEHGFTLVELLITMLVGGVMVSAIFGVVVSVMRTETFVSTTRSNLDDARVAIERIRQEVRVARRVQLTGPSSTTSNTSTLVIWADDNQDQVTQAGENIVYRLRTVGGVGQLERFTGASTTPIPVATGLDLTVVAGNARSRFAYNATPVNTANVVTVTLTVANDGDERASDLVVSEPLRLRNAPNI